MQRATIGALGIIVAGLSLWGLAATERARPLSAAPKLPVTNMAPRPSPRVLRALRDGQRLDLNAASAADLELLPGIGPSLALRIIEDRHAHGAFPAVEGLVRVRGIGPTTLAKLRPLLYVSGHGTVAEQSVTALPLQHPHQR